MTAPLSEALLAGIHSRAAQVDSAGRLAEQDLDDLRAAGYPLLLVPAALGGQGADLLTAVFAQRRLAGAAPATALAINMHLVWTAVAGLRHGAGDSSLDDVLREAAAGELLAFGISEACNDLVLFDSTTRAETAPDGSVAFTGRKTFTSLGAAWTRLGVHGRDSSDGSLVFALLDRSAATVTLDDWDALGMRGTGSGSTDLDHAVAPAHRVLARIPADAGGVHPLQASIFAAFELLVGQVYVGIARRALEIATASVLARSDRSGRPVADDGEVRHRIAEMALRLEAVDIEGEATARALDDGESLALPRLSGLKYRAVAAAKAVVDDALIVTGGAAFSASHELARLARDVTAGAFHPSSAASTHRAAAAVWLGPLA